MKKNAERITKKGIIESAVLALLTGAFVIAGCGGPSGASLSDGDAANEQVSGSDSTYYADRGEWFSNGTQFSLFGGRSGAGGGVGAFCVVLDSPVSAAGWSIGAALSLKPLT